MTAIVSDPPAPMTLAGPLAPVLEGLLTKDPAQRFDHARARAGLVAVLASGAPTAAGATATLPPPPLRPHQPSASQQPHQTQTSLSPQRTLPLPAPPRSRPAFRSRRALVAAAVVAVLLLGLGAYAVGSALVGRTGGVATTTQVAGFTAYTHPDGFTVRLPDGWQARPGTPTRVYAPTGDVWLQLYTQPVSAADPTAVWEAADRSNRSSGRNPEYSLVGIRPTRAADHSAADWEWTYLRNGESERRRVLDRVVIVNGVSYQFALSAPESRFARYRPLVDEVAASFRLAS
jgi:hypothetical protein